MAIPEDKKEGAIYHTILSDMHRLQAVLLNLQTIAAPDTEQALREHFSREQSLVLGRLTEWKQRRPDLYRVASDDFQRQARQD